VRAAATAASISAVDAAGTVPTGSSDLDETAASVEKLGRRIHIAQADVRDLVQVQAVVDDALRTFDGIDIVCANAGIGSWAVSWEMTAEKWQQMIDVNLTGVFNTVRAALPSMVSRGKGGSVVMTSSTAGILGYLNTAHYTAAKHGLIGLMKVLAQEVGPHGIRVNAVCPTTVNTPLVINDATFRLFAPDVANPGPADVAAAFSGLNILPEVPWIEPRNVSDAIAWLCSDQAAFITGAALPVDAGNVTKKN
jgi:(+)-trans-carveol dehydrogenase